MILSHEIIREINGRVPSGPLNKITETVILLTTAKGAKNVPLGLKVRLESPVKESVRQDLIAAAAEATGQVEVTLTVRTYVRPNVLSQYVSFRSTTAEGDEPFMVGESISFCHDILNIRK